MTVTAGRTLVFDLSFPVHLDFRSNFVFRLSQLEDEALKHIGAHCPELVTLNLQTCSVSTVDVARGGMGSIGKMLLCGNAQ